MVTSYRNVAGTQRRCICTARARVFVDGIAARVVNTTIFYPPLDCVARGEPRHDLVAVTSLHFNMKNAVGAARLPITGHHLQFVLTLQHVHLERRGGTEADGLPRVHCGDVAMQAVVTRGPEGKRKHGRDFRCGAVWPVVSLKRLQDRNLTGAAREQHEEREGHR